MVCEFTSTSSNSGPFIASSVDRAGGEDEGHELDSERSVRAKNCSRTAASPSRAGRYWSPSAIGCAALGRWIGRAVAGETILTPSGPTVCSTNRYMHATYLVARSSERNALSAACWSSWTAYGAMRAPTLPPSQAWPAPPRNVALPGGAAVTYARTLEGTRERGLRRGVRVRVRRRALPDLRTRRPELTALHIVVREHLETFLATVREERGKDLPRYVEQELRLRPLRDLGPRFCPRRVHELRPGDRRRVLLQVPGSVPVVLGAADVGRDVPPVR
jgi:hypothetical protein